MVPLAVWIPTGGWPQRSAASQSANVNTFLWRRCYDGNPTWGSAPCLILTTAGSWLSRRALNRSGANTRGAIALQGVPLATNGRNLSRLFGPGLLLWMRPDAYNRPRKPFSSPSTIPCGEVGLAMAPRSRVLVPIDRRCQFLPMFGTLEKPSPEK